MSTATTNPVTHDREKDRVIYRQKLAKCGHIAQKLVNLALLTGSRRLEDRVVPRSILTKDLKEDPVLSDASVRHLASLLNRQILRLEDARKQKAVRLPDASTRSSFKNPTMYTANMVAMFRNFREQIGTFDLNEMNQARVAMVNRQIENLGKYGAEFPIQPVQLPRPSVGSSYILDQIMLTAGQEIEGQVHTGIAASTVLTLLGSIYISKMDLGRYAQPPPDVANTLKANYLKALAVKTKAYKVDNTKYRASQTAPVGSNGRIKRNNLAVVPDNYLSKEQIEAVVNDTGNGHGTWANATYIGPDQNMLDTLTPQTFEALAARCSDRATEKASKATPLTAGQKVSNKTSFVSTDRFFTRADFQGVTAAHTLSMEKIAENVGVESAELYFGAKDTPQKQFLREIIEKEIAFLSAVIQTRHFNEDPENFVSDYTKKIVKINVGEVVDEKWLF